VCEEAYEESGDGSTTLTENLGDVHKQYENDDARACEEVYEEIEVILEEAELLGLDVEQVWTSEADWDFFRLILPKDVSRVVKDDIEIDVCLTIGALRFVSRSGVREL
jgi:hypothetical protein